MRAAAAPAHVQVGPPFGIVAFGVVLAVMRSSRLGSGSAAVAIASATSSMFSSSIASIHSRLTTRVRPDDAKAAQDRLAHAGEGSSVASSPSRLRTRPTVVQARACTALVSDRAHALIASEQRVERRRALSGPAGVGGRPPGALARMSAAAMAARRPNT